MVEFADWEMPLLYTGIIEEHHHTRRDGSIFDVSHMGRLELSGPDAEDLLQRVCTRQLGDMAAGQARYSLICQERGGILDDVIVSRYMDRWLVVCNASNRQTIVSWLELHKSGRNVQITDRTESTMMIAIQGPKVVPRLAEILPLPVVELKRYRFLSGTYMSVPYTISRTGYTGEDGVEVILPASAGAMIAGLLDAMNTEAVKFKPAGLGARDTLRLEAGMPLYGHELEDKIDPMSAGLEWCVDLTKNFICVEALRKIAQAGSEYLLIGVELAGRRIARQGAKVSAGPDVVGKVTSGTLSPTLGKSIAMAYVLRSFSKPGHKLSVDIGGGHEEATVVELPFYTRQKS